MPKVNVNQALSGFSVPQVSPEQWLVALIILLLTALAAWLAGRAIRHWLQREDVHLPNSSILENVVRLTVWAIGAAWALDAIGVKMAAIIATLGVAGLAISLGLQDTLSNFFSGLQIVLSQQLQPGDRIRLASGEEGVVTDVTWRNTTILSASDDLIIIPNSVLGRTLITNYSRPTHEHTVSVPFVVAYGADLDRACVLAEEAGRQAAATDDAVADSAPVVRVKALGDSGVECAVMLRARSHERRPALAEVLASGIYRRFAEEGIAFGTSNGPASASPEALAPSDAE